MLLKVFNIFFFFLRLEKLSMTIKNGLFVWQRRKKNQIKIDNKYFVSLIKFPVCSKLAIQAIHYTIDT